MIAVMGFNGFYEWMNKTYSTDWMLVGGAACWAYITDKENVNRCSHAIYSKIFPDDIDVMLGVESPTEPIAVIADGRHIEVEFVDDFQDRVSKCQNATQLASGARVLDINTILFKYSTTSDKPQIRKTRSEFLRLIKTGAIIVPDKLQEYYNNAAAKPTENPFALGLKSLKGVGVKK
ncbi:hypothetical protein AB4Y32_24040 [Paraburkholderia phymatum]|uniref:Uncharacterized protein n=1 Tax=Paraburkholderia phymatum TaxID=148447 RepID=A0ACC6U5C6_9BURK